MRKSSNDGVYPTQLPRIGRRVSRPGAYYATWRANGQLPSWAPAPIGQQRQSTPTLATSACRVDLELEPATSRRTMEIIRRAQRMHHEGRAPAAPEDEAAEETRRSGFLQTATRTTSSSFSAVPRAGRFSYARINTPFGGFGGLDTTSRRSDPVPPLAAPDETQMILRTVWGEPRRLPPEKYLIRSHVARVSRESWSKMSLPPDDLRSILPRDRLSSFKRTGATVRLQTGMTSNSHDFEQYDNNLLITKVVEDFCLQRDSILAQVLEIFPSTSIDRVHELLSQEHDLETVVLIIASEGTTTSNDN